MKLFLEDNYPQHITLALLADRFGMSISRLSAEYKKYVGTSPIDSLIHVRMNEAALMLSRLDLNIAEVARRVGYEDPFYFSKLFKKHTAKSPMEYRKLYCK